MTGDATPGGSRRFKDPGFVIAARSSFDGRIIGTLACAQARGEYVLLFEDSRP